MEFERLCGFGSTGRGLASRSTCSPLPVLHAAFQGVAGVGVDGWLDRCAGSVESHGDMRRFLFLLGALGWLGCGDEATVLPGGPGGSTNEPSAGSGGSPVAMAGAGGADTGGAGAGGSAGAPANDSDVISVDEGDFESGDPPPTEGGEALPQIVQVTGPTAVTNGGTALLHVQLSPAVASPTFVIGLEGDTGYHTVTGVDADGDGTYDISVRVASEATQASLVLSVALMDAMGNVGPYYPLSIEIVRSGTGDVKITLSFDRLHDLDLHVIEPGGEEIWFDRKVTATGGVLDLDSGENCVQSPANAENIFWPPGGAPAGTYQVKVQNFQQCSAGPIDYTVRVAYDNVVNTYEGTFPDGTASETPSANNVRDVVTFTRGVAPP
jgi:hypothetical protein